MSNIYKAPLGPEWVHLEGKKGFVFCNICHRLLSYTTFYKYDKVRFVYANRNYWKTGERNHINNAHYDNLHDKPDFWLRDKAYFYEVL